MPGATIAFSQRPRRPPSRVYGRFPQIRPAFYYFSSPTRGWFASQCTGGGDPDGFRLGGNWSIGDPDDETRDDETQDSPGD